MNSKLNCIFVLLFSTYLTVLFSSAFTCEVAFAASDTLTLNEYLKQVEGASPALQASSYNSEGALQSAVESELPLMPKFTVQANHLLDERQNTSSLFYGTRTISDTLVAGIEKQFSFGLNTKLSYTLMNNQTTGASPQFYVPNGSNIYNNAQTEIDLTQSLWRNFLGKENKATETRDEATLLMSHFNEKFNLKKMKAIAESTYYRLAVARESIVLQKDVLDRAKRILEWATRRVKNRIADRVDLLQAKTAYQQRNLDIQAGIDEERSAALAFNVVRNSSVPDVKERLNPISVQEILTLALPTKAETTDDVKAAEQNERMTSAISELSKQKALPDFSVFASAAYNGSNLYVSPAVGDSFSTQHPMYKIGVQFSFPLYFWETSEMRAGRVKHQLGAEAALVQKRLDNAQTWEDLSKKLNESKDRLKMADELVNAQKEKMEYEQQRLNLGRTTTYQVLTFEQDYSQALIQRLRIEQELLNLHSELKTYAVDASN